MNLYVWMDITRLVEKVKELSEKAGYLSNPHIKSYLVPSTAVKS